MYTSQEPRISTRVLRVHMQVPQHPRLFVLGCFEQRVTAYSQQVRALNLVHALFEEKLLATGKHLAVVGGGVGGLTAAAGALHKGCRVTVLEHNDDLLHMFAGSNERWLHPHIYDWPTQGSLTNDAGLPLMSWSAGTADAVVQQLRARWDDTVRTYSQCTVVTGAKDIDIQGPDSGQWRVAWNADGYKNSTFDAVILAVGFGVEKLFKSIGHSYWRNDGLSQSNLRQNQRPILISGLGDGGLTDFLRASLRNFRHHDLVEEFHLDPRPEANADARSLAKRLLEVELKAQDLLAQDGTSDRASLHITSIYLEELHDLARFIDAKLDKRLRPAGSVFLNGPTQSVLTPGASILNRLLTARVLRHMRYLPGELEDVQQQPTGEWRVKIAGRHHVFNTLIIRHGTKSALEEHFPAIYRACLHHMGAMRELDQTRWPLWPASYFGREEPRQLTDSTAPPLLVEQSAGRTSPSHFPSSERPASSSDETPGPSIAAGAHAPASSTPGVEPVVVTEDNDADAPGAPPTPPPSGGSSAEDGEAEAPVVAVPLTDEPPANESTPRRIARRALAIARRVLPWLLGIGLAVGIGLGVYYVATRPVPPEPPKPIIAGAPIDAPAPPDVAPPPDSLPGYIVALEQKCWADDEPPPIAGEACLALAKRAVMFPLSPLPSEDEHYDPVKNLKRSCEFAVPEGCSLLAENYEGASTAIVQVEVPKDLLAAIQWYSKGCDGGDELSCRALIRLSSAAGEHQNSILAAWAHQRLCRQAESACADFRDFVEKHTVFWVGRVNTFRKSFKELDTPEERLGNHWHSYRLFTLGPKENSGVHAGSLRDGIRGCWLSHLPVFPLPGESVPQYDFDFAVGREVDASFIEVKDVFSSSYPELSTCLFEELEKYVTSLDSKVGYAHKWYAVFRVHFRFLQGGRMRIAAGNFDDVSGKGESGLPGVARKRISFLLESDNIQHKFASCWEMPGNRMPSDFEVEWRYYFEPNEARIAYPLQVQILNAEAASSCMVEVLEEVSDQFGKLPDTYDYSEIVSRQRLRIISPD